MSEMAWKYEKIEKRVRAGESKIFQNWNENTGVSVDAFMDAVKWLSAEKRVKYTYGTEAATAVASDELIVSLPEKSKGWEVYETAAGGLAVESPWGMQYDINEVLAGDKEPQFRTWDNDGVRYITLKVWED